MADPDDPRVHGGAPDAWAEFGDPVASFDRAVLQAVDAALELPPERRRPYIESDAALDPSSRLRALALLSECEFVEGADAARRSGPAEDHAGLLSIDLPALLRAADWESGGAERLRPGAMLGHYRIERFIAAGGMGEVYEATDTRIGRRVAIKTLPRFADQERAQRFIREARIMARLEHPSIARLYEWGAPDRTEGGYPFIVMEFVEGRPIREAVAAIRSEGGGAVDIVRLVLPVIDAVAHAHARGVLHRDIKPGNILVDRSGCARLLDFGVAAILESEEVAAGTLTEAGAPGTLNYMSPEHVRGGASR
ncbi:MAG: Serine/threonine-protein kinase PrkC, partial [Planctomycetota bacterium]